MLIEATSRGRGHSAAGLNAQQIENRLDLDGIGRIGDGPHLGGELESAHPTGVGLLVRAPQTHVDHAVRRGNLDRDAETTMRQAHVGHELARFQVDLVDGLTVRLLARLEIAQVVRVREREIVGLELFECVLLRLDQHEILA